MTAAGRFITARGMTCTIERTPSASSYVSMRQASKRSTNPGTREAMWEGLVLTTSGLTSGEVLTVGTDRYLVQTVYSDPASGELAWFGVKTNVELEHQRYVESVVDGNLVQAWSPLASNIAAFGQIVTAELRQADPGLLDSCKYTFQVPSAIAPIELDRMVMGGSNYRVDAVDSIMLPGVVRLQCGSDNRV